MSKPIIKNPEVKDYKSWEQAVIAKTQGNVSQAEEDSNSHQQDDNESTETISESTTEDVATEEQSTDVPTENDSEESIENDEQESSQSEDNSNESSEDLNEDTEEDQVIDDWDKGSERSDQENEPSEESSVDSSEFEKKLAEDLGLELSENESLSEKIKSKLSEDPKEDVLDGVPDKLKKAVELAKEGADYEQYLSVNNVDYDNVSDVDLYANAVAGYFKNEDGSINEENLQEHIDGLSDAQLGIESDKIRQSLKLSQESVIRNLENEAKQRKLDRVQGVDNALKNYDEVLGFKVNPYQKEKIKESIVNDSFVKDLVYSNGKIDYKKAVDVKFKADNFDKIVKYLKTKGLNEGKKQIIDTMSNAQPRPKGEATGKNISRSAEKSPQQVLMEQFGYKYK